MKEQAAIPTRTGATRSATLVDPMILMCSSVVRRSLLDPSEDSVDLFLLEDAACGRRGHLVSDRRRVLGDLLVEEAGRRIARVDAELGGVFPRPDTDKIRVREAGGHDEALRRIARHVTPGNGAVVRKDHLDLLAQA